MFWITIDTADGRDYLDAVSFMIQENGMYCILLLDGTQREGWVKEITFLHIEQVTEN